MVQNFSNSSFQDPLSLALFILALVWSLVWKGLALWKAAGQKDKWWFIALLVVNTLGVLEIAYIFYFAEAKQPRRLFRKFLSWKKMENKEDNI